MADEDAGEAAEAKPDGKKGFKLLEGKSQAQREKILVATGVGGLLLTVLILRKQTSAKNQQAAANAIPQYPTSTNPTPGDTTSGTATDPNTGVPYATEVSGLQQALAGASSSGMSATSALPSSPGVAPGLTGTMSPVSFPNPTSAAPSSSSLSQSPVFNVSNPVTVDLHVNGIPEGHPSTTQIPVTANGKVSPN